MSGLFAQATSAADTSVDTPRSSAQVFVYNSTNRRCKVLTSASGLAARGPTGWIYERSQDEGLQGFQNLKQVLLQMV